MPRGVRRVIVLRAICRRAGCCDAFQAARVTDVPREVCVRTRRSPKNQERLWRELGRQGVRAALPATVTAAQVIRVDHRCWDCVSYPPGGRSRGACSLTGTMVNGRSENRPCFRVRT